MKTHGADQQNAPGQRRREPLSIVLNGSPLFTGGEGSCESKICRYAMADDLVEAIIGLPSDMFYNTGISTYVRILSNRTPVQRKGKLQLIDAYGFWRKMRKSLGSKRKEPSEEHTAEITCLCGQFIEADEKPPLQSGTTAGMQEVEQRLERLPRAG